MAAVHATTSSEAPLQLPLLVLGVLSDERRPRWRQRLREYYAPYTQSGVLLVRYVLDERWMARRRHPVNNDEIGVPVGRGRDRHCAHKMVGWWTVSYTHLTLPTICSV